MSKVTAMLNRYKADALAFWGARSEQERKLLGVGAGVVLLALAYALLVEPALSGRAELEKSLPALRQEAADLQALARQAAELSAQAPGQVPAMSRDTLQAALAAHSLSAQSLSLTGEYAKLQLKGVPFANLMACLDALRRERRVAVHDAQIVAQGAAGLVDASLTLHQNQELAR